MRVIPKRTIFFERVDAPIVLKYFLLNLLSQMDLFCEPNSLSKWAQFLIHSLKKMRVGFEFKDPELRVCRSDGTCNDFYNSRLHLFSLSKEFLDQIEFSKVDRWYASLSSSYISMMHDNQCSYLGMLLQRISENSIVGKIEIKLRKLPLSEKLVELFHIDGIRIDFSVDRFSLKIERLIHTGRMMVSALISLLLPHRPLKSSLKEVKPSFWVEYENIKSSGSSVGKNRNSNSIFFMGEQLDHKTYDVVFYNDRLDSEVDKVSIEGPGYHWIEMKRGLAREASFSFSDCIELLKLFFLTLRFSNAWWFQFQFEASYKYLILRKIYQKYNVKCLMHHQDSSWFTLIQKRALESCGSIVIGCHWSFYTGYLATMSFASHLYFVWGAIQAEFVEKVLSEKKEDLPLIAPCGVWITKTKTACEEVAQFCSQFSFTITALDQNAGDYYVVSSKALIQFWETIVEILERYKDFGVVVKRKNHSDFLDLHDHEGGSRLLDRIAKVGSRILVLNSTRSPQDASTGTNLVASLGTNSAGLIAATEGVLSIFWNNAGWKYRNSSYDFSNIFFDDLNEFKKALVAAIEGDSSVGKSETVFGALDYFRDGQAKYRVGKFIDSTMKAAATGNLPLHSLEENMATYFKENNVPANWRDKYPEFYFSRNCLQSRGTV